MRSRSQRPVTQVPFDQPVVYSPFDQREGGDGKMAWFRHCCIEPANVWPWFCVGSWDSKCPRHTKGGPRRTRKAAKAQCCINSQLRVCGGKPGNGESCTCAGFGLQLRCVMVAESLWKAFWSALAGCWSRKQGSGPLLDASCLNVHQFGNPNQHGRRQLR